MSEQQKPQKEEPNQKDPPIERIFLANDLLPSASDAFLAEVDSIEKAIDTADIVLDTNVLLLPYGAGASSLKQVITVFKQLKNDGRLFLPAQVAREFVKNRPNKLADLQQGLSDRISRYPSIDKLFHPILEDVDEYKQLNQALEKSSKLKTDLTKINSALVKQIRSWEWNDPVNTAYKEVFTADRIFEPNIKREEALAEFKKRLTFQIPPGYKDSAKDDMGIGDFLIWMTILQLAAKNKKHMIFVSGDEKSDWQHRAGGTGFLPRYELMDEFRRASSGKSFYIVQLSILLELLKVEKTSIEEIKKEETRVQEATNLVVACPSCATKVQCYLAEYPNSSALSSCPVCSISFHIHRTVHGIITRVAHLPAKSEIESDIPVLEKVSCPNCNIEVEGILGNYRGATISCVCDSCKTHFNMHRNSDGGVLIGRLRQKR